MAPTPSDYHLDSPKMKPFVTKLCEMLVLMAGGDPLDFKEVICTAAGCEQYNHGVLIMAKDTFHARDAHITKLLKYILAVDKDDARRLRVAVKTLYIALVRGEQQARARYDTVISNVAARDLPTLLASQIAGDADPETDYHVREIKLGTDVQEKANTIFYLLHEPRPPKPRKLRKLADVIETPDSDSQAAASKGQFHQTLAAGPAAAPKCDKTQKATDNTFPSPGIVLSPDNAAALAAAATASYDNTELADYETTAAFDPTTASLGTKPEPDTNNNPFARAAAAARAIPGAAKGPRGDKSPYGDV